MPKSSINDNVSAVRKLELSRLDPRAQKFGGMAKDTDVESFALYLSSKVKTNLVDRIIDAEVERTVEGASTLTVDVSDDDGSLLNSGLLTNKLDIEIDGLWFRFTAVDINESDLSLVFEQREVSVLKDYMSWKIARRANTTRAEFVLNLIKEVREFKIPFVIPELHKVQPIEAFSGDILGADPYAGIGGGIPADAAKTSTDAAAAAAIPAPALTAEDRRRGQGTVLYVKGSPITPEQIANANTIIAVGKGMPEVQKSAPKRLIQAALMTAIIESTIHNLTPAKSDPTPGTSSAGIFQQQNNWGSLADRMDPATASRLFYLEAIKEQAKNPTEALWLLCANVQHPREDLRTKYADAQVEAARIMGAYGEVAAVTTANNMQQNAAGGSQGTNYAFWRGSIEDRHGNKIRKPENSWHCIQRLADDVDWRAYFIAGTFYYMSEDDLFKQKPVGTITRYMEGMTALPTGNYDRHKKSGMITIKCAVGKWTFPPGSVVIVQQMGPLNGRWIVTTFRRSLFSDEAEIVLKKPRPALPEPLNDDSQQVQPGWYDQNMPKDQGMSGTVPADQKSVIQAVLKDANIQYSNPTSQKSDINTGQIDIRVLQFLLYASQNGWGPFMITALKSDHSKYTTGGNLSAHGAGRAVDIGTFNEGNARTDGFMKWVALGQSVTGFDQLIGPNPLLVLPPGYYDGATLAQHKNHCHIGWHM